MHSNSKIDPITFFDSEIIESVDIIEQGDFIRCRKWPSPLRVDLVEKDARGTRVYVNHPESGPVSFGDRVFRRNGKWKRYPVLRELYERAHR